jgi:asparagine synthetase B (glutamine-hydrolysing)
MCGIAGVVSTIRESNIPEALVYRGPDDEGLSAMR